MSEHPVYLDHNATTPVDPRVVDAIADALRTTYGNPASRHDIGARAEAAVQTARQSVAALINADPEDVIFTSGATEANNLAVAGTAARRGDRNTMVTSEIEHPSILEPATFLERQGAVVRRLGPTPDGIIDSGEIGNLIDETVFLVSVMSANNEIGTINDIQSIAGVAHSRGALVHTDATQAVGHIPVDVKKIGVDLLSCSAHKLYGPKGIGALFAHRKARLRLVAQMLGGGHERGLRSGTLNVPAIVGFGVAADIARREMADSSHRVSELRNLLLELLKAKLPHIVVNGWMERRLPGNLSVSIPGVDADALVVRLRGVASFSTGAACSSAKVEPSHVLIALSRNDDRAFSSIRFGIGRGNTKEEIETVADAVAKEALLLMRFRRRS